MAQRKRIGSLDGRLKRLHPAHDATLLPPPWALGLLGRPAHSAFGTTGLVPAHVFGLLFPRFLLASHSHHPQHRYRHRQPQALRPLRIAHFCLLPAQQPALLIFKASFRPKTA